MKAKRIIALLLCALMVFSMAAGVKDAKITVYAFSNNGYLYIAEL